jgi:hypothetical protein
MIREEIIFEKGQREFSRLVSFLKALPVDIRLKINIGEAKGARSDLQNKALWGCAYKTICDKTGNDPEDIHELMCGEYFGWKTKIVLGKKHLEPKRWTTRDEEGKRDVINTVHLSDFYGFIQRYAAEKAGIYVPDPDPHWFEHRQAAA